MVTCADAYDFVFARKIIKKNIGQKQKETKKTKVPNHFWFQSYFFGFGAEKRKTLGETKKTKETKPEPQKKPKNPRENQQKPKKTKFSNHFWFQSNFFGFGS